MTEQQQGTQQEAPPEPVLVQVEVTNNTEYPIQDMFDGIPYVFPVGQAVVISPDVARHCFGFPGAPRDMAIHMAKRYGWANPETLKWTSHQTPEYVEKATKVVFEPIFYDLVRRKASDPIPAVVTDEEIEEKPVPEPVSTTVVGKSRRYANATRAKRRETEDTSRGAKGRGSQKRGRGRVPHINVREA